jgi:hypothetical protein
MSGNPDTAGKSHSGFTESYVMKITRRNVEPRGKAQCLKHFTHPAPLLLFSLIPYTTSPALHKPFSKTDERGEISMMRLNTKS